MENLIEFVTELSQLIEFMRTVIDNEGNQGILVSGTFDNIIYKQLLDEIIKGDLVQHCKIIIPFVSKSGIISRPYLNKIICNGGQLRTNSKFTNNLIVIGKYAFVISLSYKFNRDYGLKTNFENCMVTNNKTAVEKIQSEFMNSWEKSLPLANGV